MVKLIGDKPLPRRSDVWSEMFSIKNLTGAKRNLIKKLTKDRPLKEDK